MMQAWIVPKPKWVFTLTSPEIFSLPICVCWHYLPFLLQSPLPPSLIIAGAYDSTGPIPSIAKQHCALGCQILAVIIGSVPELKVKDKEVTHFFCTVRESAITLFHLSLCSPLSYLPINGKAGLMSTPEGKLQLAVASRLNIQLKQIPNVLRKKNRILDWILAKQRKSKILEYWSRTWAVKIWCKHQNLHMERQRPIEFNNLASGPTESHCPRPINCITTGCCPQTCFSKVRSFFFLHFWSFLPFWFQELEEPPVAPLMGEALETHGTSTDFLTLLVHRMRSSGLLLGMYQVHAC